MIKNKPNFVPAKYELQPEKYKQYFDQMAAVFRHPVNGRNLLLVVKARVRYGQDPFDAKGNLEIQYQGEKSRHSLTLEEFTSLESAMKKVKAILDNPHYGDEYDDKPELVRKMNGSFYVNGVLAEKQAKAYKAKCKYFKPVTPFVLTDKDKETLRRWGERKEDIKSIEVCANESVYLIYKIEDGTGKYSENIESITLEKTLELLSREVFLSGIARSCFHLSCVRETEDGKYGVIFESGTNSPYRKIR